MLAADAYIDAEMHPPSIGMSPPIRADQGRIGEGRSALTEAILNRRSCLPASRYY
jgi:hypothetical protein